MKAWVKEKCLPLLQPISSDFSHYNYGCLHPLKRALGSVQFPRLTELKAALDKVVDNGKRNDKYLSFSKLPDRWEEFLKTK